MMPNNNPAPTQQKALSVSTFLCRITDISFSSFTLNCRYFSSLLSIMQRYTFSPQYTITTSIYIVNLSKNDKLFWENKKFYLPLHIV